MVFDRRIMQFSEPVTSGEEFRNRSEGAKRGWLKRASQKRTKVIEERAKKSAASKVFGAYKEADFEKEIQDQLAREVIRKSVEDKYRAFLKNPRNKLVIDEKTVADPYGESTLKQFNDEAGLLLGGATLAAAILNRKALIKGAKKSPLGKVVRKGIVGVKKAKRNFGRRKSVEVKSVGRSFGEGVMDAVTPEPIKQVAKKVKATKTQATTDLETLENTPITKEVIVQPSALPDKSFNTRLTAKIENDKARVRNFYAFLQRRAEQDRLRRKKNLGFRKYSNNFWIKFNNRKQKNIEFFNSKSSSYIKFSQRRKPMSEATKRKISKSLARSKGSTAGYDTEISAMTNRGNLIDNGIESIGKLTKAVSPILRYINERQNIAERKKRRQIQAVNTAIYGVGTGSRLLNTATSGKLARERLASRQNLLERQLQSREGLERLKADTRVRVETIKDSSRRISASAYKRQADSQRMKELSRMKIPPQTQTWNDLFNL